MLKRLAALRRILPARRRRHWRYVSGRRRRIGLVAFALLALVAYGYARLTDNSRVRRHVRRYLAQVTGGRAKVEQAKFSLFGGIQVRGLRVWLPDGVDVTFFEADQVRLVHNPWTLLLRGRLEPTEIVCVHPKVRLVEDVTEGKLTVLRIFPLAWRGAGATKGPLTLPVIRLREMELVRIDLEEDNQLVPVGRWERLSVVLEPDQQKQLYVLSFEGPSQAKPPISGKGTIHVATGETHIEGWAGLHGLDDALPRKYRRWRRQYKLAGEVRWMGDAHVGTLLSNDDPGQLNQLDVELVNVSMQLPPRQGGIKLEGVKGKIVFFQENVKIEQLQGQIAHAGGAQFKLKGEFGGYKPTDPFRISFDITGLTFPFGKELFRACGEQVGQFHERLNLAGCVDLSGKLWRESPGEKFQLQGWAKLRDVSLSLPEYAIRVEQVSGDLTFGNETLTLANVIGRHGPAEVRIAGTVGGTAKEPVYDISVDAKGLPFTQEVRQALPASRRRLWDTFSPRGSGNFAVRLRRGPDEKPTKTLTIELDGGASLEYRRFPYRLEQVVGRIVVDSAGAKIVSLKGRAGPMTCVLSGEVLRRPDGHDVDITIEEISNLPLDERLARALPSNVRAAYRACGLSGFADTPRAKFTRPPGGPLEFTIPVSLRQASITHEAFPYLITDASGELTLTRGKAVIHHLVGRHGTARVSVSGQTLLKAPRQVLDLKVEATELSLDDELRRALPPAAQRWWELLAPAGAADVALKLRTVLGTSPGGPTEPPPAATAKAAAPPADNQTYHLLVRPRRARILYRHFPYLLRDVNGTVEIVPGKMTLRRLMGLAGDTSVTLDGEVLTDVGRERAKLKVNTGPMPIDRRLLSALPEGLVKALEVTPGGTVRLDLQELEIWRPAGTATRPATGGDQPAAGAAGAATQPAGQLAWKWTGTIAVSGASMGLGLGGKRIDGTIKGTMACAGPAATLQTAAEVTLSDFVFGSHRLEKASASLAKGPGTTTLRIDNLSGRSLGGMLAGKAYLSLAAPARYAVNLSVEGVSIKQLIAAARKDPKNPLDIKGLLSGQLQMTATPGDPTSRRATGKFRITKAKLYKLPVLLGFLNVIYLSLPGDSAFDSADVEYYLRGQKLVFREIHLRGSALSMLGAGTVNTRTERLKLTFLTGPPRKVPRLEALSEFLDGLTVGLRTIRVTGTLKDPKTHSRPFRDIDKTLREIHDPEGQ